MLDEAQLTKELGRLMKLPFAPADGEDRKALMLEWRRVARKYLRTNAHVKAVADHLMEHSQRVPTPADLVEAAGLVPEPERTTGPLGCATCEGSGWHSDKKAMTQAGPFRYEAVYTDYCHCERGQWMRACETARREKASEKHQKKTA